MNYYNKHYIRLDVNNYIIKGFSDAFEQPEESDTCINQEGGRHFELLGQNNPTLVNIQGVHLYKYVNGTVSKTTAEEQAMELETIKKPEFNQEKYLIDIDYRISKLELGV